MVLRVGREGRAGKLIGCSQSTPFLLGYAGTVWVQRLYPMQKLVRTHYQCRAQAQLLGVVLGVDGGMSKGLSLWLKLIDLQITINTLEHIPDTNMFRQRSSGSLVSRLLTHSPDINTLSVNRFSPG